MQSRAETEVAGGKEEGKEEDARAVVGFFFLALFFSVFEVGRRRKR